MKNSNGRQGTVARRSSFLQRSRNRKKALSNTKFPQAGEIARIWDHPFYGWFALLIFFNYSFLLESLAGLAGAFQTVGSVVFFYQKLGLHLFRLRELRVTQRFLTVSSSFEEKNFFG